MQRQEPLFVRALISEFAVEALDVGVLHRLARLDERKRPANSS
jgi:hypothetical protein